MKYKKFYKYIILILGIFYSNISNAENVINFIDINFLMNESIAGKSIILQLEDITTSTNKKLKKTEDELKKQETILSSQKNIISKEEYTKKVKSFSKKVSEYNLSRKNMINDISKIKSQAQKTLLNTLTEILTDYSEKNSISYIIPKQNIVIGKTELDITNVIIKILNTKIKNIKVK